MSEEQLIALMAAILKSGWYAHGSIGSPSRKELVREAREILRATRPEVKHGE